MRRFRAWQLAGLLLLAPPALAQTEVPPPSSPILTIDQERLYAASAWGKRASAYLSDESVRLSAENRELEAKLVAEEKDLTDARPTMDPDVFRKAADAFDARVVELRRTQDGKARAIARISDAERQKFYAAVLPVLGEVLRRRGAVLVLDSRAIFVSVEAIDVTDEMIDAIDTTIGAGENAPDPTPEPMPPPTGEGAN